jgi:lysozyme family protein
VTAADVKAMPLWFAKAVYKAKYWDAEKGDALLAGVDYSIFDYGVNSGIGRSGKVLRRVLGLSDSTSVVSDDVLAALSKRDAKAVVIAINDERLRFLKGLKTWDAFGVGWERRVKEVKAFSLHLVEAAPHELPPQVTKPANDAEAAKGMVPPPVVAKKIIVAGGGAGSVATGGTFADWIAAHPFEAGVAATAAVVTIGAAVYALERRHKAKQEAPVPGVAVVPEKLAA